MLCKTVTSRPWFAHIAHRGTGLAIWHAIRQELNSTNDVFLHPRQRLPTMADLRFYLYTPHPLQAGFFPFPTGLFQVL